MAVVICGKGELAQPKIRRGQGAVGRAVNEQENRLTDCELGRAEDDLEALAEVTTRLVEVEARSDQPATFDGLLHREMGDGFDSACGVIHYIGIDRAGNHNCIRSRDQGSIGGHDITGCEC